MRNLTALSFILTMGTLCVRAQFVPDDIQVGSASVNYIDPEFLSEHSRMVFQDAQTAGNLYVGLIDPLTGTLVSADGKDLLLDTNIAALGNTGLTANGPEWGLDSGGPAVFYEKTGSNGLVQVWRAQGILSGPVQVQQLTSSTTVRLDTVHGWNYQLQYFLSLASWINLGPPFPGNNAVQQSVQDVGTQPRVFFRATMTKTTQ